jgi:PilZ domain
VISRTIWNPEGTARFYRQHAMMPPERRLSTRKTPEQLAYISLPSNNGGIVIDVSEGGLGFHAIGPVDADGPIHFRFAIDSAERVAAVGELAWKDKTGKTGGLRFTELPEEIRERIRLWAGQSNSTANSRAKAIVLDVPVVEPAIEADAAPGSKIDLAPVADIQVAEPAIDAEVTSGSKGDLAPVMAARNPLLYNLKPPIYSGPSNKLSMFPLELDFKARATAAVVPQFVQMLDEIAEQVRVWAAEWKANGHDDPFADPAFETEVAPRSETELAPVPNIPMDEPAVEFEEAHGKIAELAPVVDIPIAQAEVETEVAPRSHVDLVHDKASSNPQLYNLKPPIYSGPSNTLSMFPLEPNSHAGETAAAVPQSGAMKHPFAAVGLTIVLAFLVSIGIFAYVATSQAGEMLFDWGEKMWGGAYSQPIPGDAAPPASRAPDSAKTPRQ